MAERALALRVWSRTTKMCFQTLPCAGCEVHTNPLTLLGFGLFICKMVCLVSCTGLL